MIQDAREELDIILEEIFALAKYAEGACDATSGDSSAYKSLWEALEILHADLDTFRADHFTRDGKIIKTISG